MRRKIANAFLLSLSPPLVLYSTISSLHSPSLPIPYGCTLLSLGSGGEVQRFVRD